MPWDCQQQYSSDDLHIPACRDVFSLLSVKKNFGFAWLTRFLYLHRLAVCYAITVCERPASEVFYAEEKGSAAFPVWMRHEKVDTVNHTTKYIRDFKPETSSCIWTTDVSEFHIAAGKLYLSPILDLFDHSIVSYNISASPNFCQTTDMLSKAFAANNHLDGLIFHSDQGWQYQMAQYQQILKEHKIVQSMSRKGNCLDNCIMENFFGKMKNEMFYGHEYEFKSLDELKEAIVRAGRNGPFFAGL